MSSPPIRPAPATPAYWADRRNAFGLIRTLEAAIAERRRAPQFIAGEWDFEAEDWRPIENVAPWDAVGRLQAQAGADPTVVDILTAQDRRYLLTA